MLRLLPLLLLATLMHGGEAMKITWPTKASGDYQATPGGPVIMRYCVWRHGTGRANTPGGRPGLIVGLHGNGAAEEATFYLINRGLTFAQLQGEYLILGLKSKGAGWEDSDHEAILKTVRWAITHFEVDPDRVMAYGESKGAMCLGRLVPRNPGLFAAVVQGSGNVTDLPANPPGAADTGWFIIHGDADVTVSVDNSRKAAIDLRAAGYPVVFREMRGLTHFYANEWTAEVMPDAMRFLNAHRLCSATRAAADVKLISSASTALAAGKGVPAKTLARLVDLDGADISAVLGLGLASKDTATRTMCAQLSANRLYHPGHTPALIALLADKTDVQRLAAIRALGLRANYGDQSALDALAALALDTKAPLKERQAATAPLAASMRLQLRLSNATPAFAATLTTLSADRQPALAALAKAGLQGLVDLVDGAPVMLPSASAAPAK